VATGSVGLLAFPVSRDWGQSAVAWWEAEFWNERVTRAYVTPTGTFTYTPFPSRVLQLDFGSGRFPGTETAPPYVLTSGTDARFVLAGAQNAANLGMVLLAADRPYRARWATRGLLVDGWTMPGRPATLRIYAQPGDPTRLARVTVTLNLPSEATSAVRYRLAGKEASIAPGVSGQAVVETCIPRGRHADLTLTSDRAATIGGPPLGPKPGLPRDVGAAVSGVEITPGGNC
jgi:hypothetical protein